jgi:hypothetical protein
MVLAATWFLWGQDEKFWSFRLLNVIPGPTRSYPYIVGEYGSDGQCLEGRIKLVNAQIELWNLPEVQEDIKKFGRLRSVTWYACIPSPFKPERIDSSAWR